MLSLSRLLDARPVDGLWTDVDECSSYCELIGCFQPQRTSQQRVYARLANDWLKFTNEQACGQLSVHLFICSLSTWFVRSLLFSRQCEPGFIANRFYWDVTCIIIYKPLELNVLRDYDGQTCILRWYLNRFLRGRRVYKELKEKSVVPLLSWQKEQETHIHCDSWVWPHTLVSTHQISQDKYYLTCSWLRVQ